MLPQAVRWCAPPVLGLLLLTGCGSLQGPPSFQQAYGIVDEPCAAGKAVTRCTAHVLLVNRGGEGLGHATIAIPMKDASGTAGAISTVKCGTPIPRTPAGGYADLTCDFDLPAGKAVNTVPSLSTVDFTVAGGSSAKTAGDDAGGLATLALAATAALLALATLGVAITGRLRRRSAPAARQPGGDAEDGTW